MPRKAAVVLNTAQRYLAVRDILIYITNSPHAVCNKELLRDVVDISESALKEWIPQLIKEGLIEIAFRGIGGSYYYRPSDVTRDLYGHLLNTTPK